MNLWTRYGLLVNATVVLLAIPAIYLPRGKTYMAVALALTGISLLCRWMVEP